MGKKQKGYTIIEVLIFLAISGALFSAAVVGMGGQQNNLRFKQSMETMEFKIRTMLSDVDRGYAAKPDDSKNYDCSLAGNQPAESGTRDAQCIFVGKEINMCTNNMFIATRVAPYNRQNYTETNSTIISTIATAQDFFSAPGSIELKTTATNQVCRIAALNSIIGSSNQRVPRYSATAANDDWQPIIDTSPVVLCFKDEIGTGRYATIKISQADVLLEIGVAKCDT